MPPPRNQRRRPPPRPRFPTRTGLPPEAIREAQALLGALGYRPGPADGIWGRRTGAAYQAFLRDAGLPAAEILTPEALRAMRAIAEREGAAEAGQPATAAADTPPAPPAPVPPDALHQAAQTGDIEVLKAALAAGVDVDARDGQGWTALMHAVNKGYPLLVEPLLAAGAGVDIRAPDGATALFMAAAHGHTEIVVLLMKAGADISIRGPKGKTAVEVARTRYGDPDPARAGGEDPAVLALLDGKTLAEVEAEVRRKERLAREWPRGKKFRDCAECPEMVVVPAGRFRMGSPESERGRDNDEGPMHEITIAEPFAVGVYEVTRGEWSRFVSEEGYSGGDSCLRYAGGEWSERSSRSWRWPGFGQTDGHPVVCVNREDAQAYVDWLSRKTGKEYRLPSESEWEYAARGGKGTARYWGESESGQCRHANGRDRAFKRRHSDWKGPIVSCDDGHVHTAPVGSFDANGYGLHDALGNVWEWVEDCWHDDYRGAPGDGGAWTVGGDCAKRVLRGGSWDTQPRFLRSANRRGTTAVRSRGNGFRVARTLIP
ncbi:MAG: SUMF1/EgtB/PvdO family nonheme iron enzyme [Thiotrichales bacterium]|nr:SUMF1/EgtB/PvdO family nonheme iron enzyme [Thiotrichales bacterium]